MTPFTLGPVELHVVALEGENPSPGVLRALGAQVDSGVVRVLDFVIVTKSGSGDVAVREVEPGEVSPAWFDLLAPGLAGEEDIFALASRLAPGESAAIVALELAWARELATELAGSGGVVVATERIPAPVVNALVDLATDD